MSRKLMIVAAAAISGLLALAPGASALSKHVFSTSITGSGATALINPTDVAVDQSTGDVYVTNAPIDERQEVTVNATGGTYTLTFEGETTAPIAFDAPAIGQGSVRRALLALSTVGGVLTPEGEGEGAVGVTGPHGGPYVVEFTTAFVGSHLGNADQPQLIADPSGLTAGVSTVEVRTTRPGSAAADVEKFDSSAHFLLIFGKRVNRTKVELREQESGHSEPLTVTEAEENVCTAASGDTCQPGTPGEGAHQPPPSQLSDPEFVAVDNSGGLSNGAVYVGDKGPVPGDILFKFDPAGEPVATWAREGQLNLDPGYNPNIRKYRPPGGGGADPVEGLAVDVEGDLIFSSFSENTFSNSFGVFRIGQFGSFTSSFGGQNTTVVKRIASGPDEGLLATESDEAVHQLTLDGVDLGALTAAGFGGPPTALAADLSAGQVFVADAGTVIREYGPGCEPSAAGCAPTDSFGAGDLGEATGLAVDESTGTLYAADPLNHRVDVFAPASFLPDATTEAATEQSDEGAVLHGQADPAEAGEVTACSFEYVDQSEFEANGFQGAATAACEPATHFSAVEQVHAVISGLSTEITYHYRLAAANANGTGLSRGRTFTPHVVVGLTTEPPTGVSGDAATLNGSLLGDGTSTHYHFEWGTSTGYGHQTPQPATGIGSPSGPNPTPLSAAVTGLKPNTTYHYRVVAENGAAETSNGEDVSFTTPAELPGVTSEAVSEVRSDSALVHAEVNPGSSDTIYRVEYGLEDCSVSACPSFPTPGLPVGNGKQFVPVALRVEGLNPGATYHYRVIAQSVAGMTAGLDRTFTTLPFVALENDPCANAHVRQQTSAAALPDCRAYELVSAADAGGYDVESNVIAGQTPFAGYPEADGRVLYGVHHGGIPGSNHPTNRGVDPYVATRGTEGWSTEYVGIPADNPFSAGSFSSTPSGSDSSLEAFAFGGQEGCSPCFEGGYTGVPVHLPNGELVQGMVAGAGVPAPPPSAEPEGKVAKDLSANGEHLIFGSTTLFAAGGNDETGDVSIYDRNLRTSETHAVSKTPTGEAMTGPGISELDVSHDGSRILIGQQVAEDTEGNPNYHLYMNVSDSPNTIDLTPGATDGVLYDGMNDAGTKVFFTTGDALTTAGNQDTDTSPDIYMMDLSNPASRVLSRISIGAGAGNTDSCEPAANSAHEHWNSVEPEGPDCGAVALGGGGGVGSADGSIYFLSPEKLTAPCGCAQPGDPKEDQPNLYVARPGDGYAPHFVATLESVLTGPQPPKLRRAFEKDLQPTFAAASALAVAHSSGDLYVLDSAANTVEKFDSEGNLVTSFGDTSPSPDGHLVGTATPAGSFAESFFGFIHPTNLAVDQSSGDLYVPDIEHEVVDRFSSSGEYLSQIPVSLPSGVAVNPANGDLYVSGLFGSVSIFDSSGTPLSSFPTEGLAASIAVDSAGTVYVTYSAELDTGATQVFESSGKHVSTLDSTPGQSVAVDTSNADVYVDEGEAIGRYDSSGNRLETLGSKPGDLSGSVGVAIDPEGSLYATNNIGAAVALFPASLAPDPRIDNALVIDSVGSSEARHSAEFQTNPSGSDAVFSSTLSLTGHESGETSEIYRYGAAEGGGAKRIDCVSCDPTNGEATGAPALASDGLSLTSDGRVLFTTGAALVAGDTDGKRDVYEWEAQGAGNCQQESPRFNPAIDACLGLISAGTGPFDSGLLSVDRSGRDAYFFTRDSLAPQDTNGPTMKIYDAREGGGFPYLFPQVACKASDECHGPASSVPGPQELGSETGTPEPAKRCKRGFVLKHGHCRRKPRRHRHRHHPKQAHGKHGGAK